MNAPFRSVIALVGFMGSGKTTIGRLLAERLGRSFIDLDSCIETVAGMSIPEYFKIFGEPAFRAIEHDALVAETARGQASVVACGGGVIESQDNRNILSSLCITIWLDIPEGELVRRLRDDHSGRPMLTGDLEARVRLLFKRRYGLYGSTAHIRYSWKEGDSESVAADTIMALLESAAGRNL